MNKAAAYSLLTLYPDAERVDLLAIGAVALDAEGHWHVAVLPTSDKLAPIAPSSPDRLARLATNLRELLADCATLAEARAMLGRAGSTLALHEFEGFFSYTSAQDFERQIAAVMHESVLPPAPPVVAAVRLNKVRQHVRARLRRQFERLGIMGTAADDIEQHMVVRNYPVSARYGLTAEFALKNAVMHITETVDFEVADDSVRGKTFEAQAKCLVMRAARDTFGQGTQCYVVVSGSGAGHAARSVDLLSTAGQVFAAESGADMQAYLDLIARAARATGQIGLN